MNKPMIGRKPKPPTNAAKVIAKPKPQIVTLDLGRDIYTHEGVRVGPGEIQIDVSTEEGERMHSNLLGAIERVKKSEQEHLKGLRREGILNPELPPIHEELDPDNLPEGYQLYATDKDRERAEGGGRKTSAEE